MTFSSQTLSVHHVTVSPRLCVENTQQWGVGLPLSLCLFLSVCLSLSLRLSLSHARVERLRVTLFQKNSLLEICFICSVASRSRKLMD